MQIDEEFLIENNITKEEYEEYYNSLEMPEIEKTVNKFGLITLLADDIGISFRTEYMTENEAMLNLENDYRKSKTEIYFQELTRQNQPEEVIEPEIEITDTELAIYETQANVEYLVCLQEMNMFMEG